MHSNGQVSLHQARMRLAKRAPCQNVQVYGILLGYAGKYQPGSPKCGCRGFDRKELSELLPADVLQVLIGRRSPGLDALQLLVQLGHRPLQGGHLQLVPIRKLGITRADSTSSCWSLIGNSCEVTVPSWTILICWHEFTRPSPGVVPAGAQLFDPALDQRRQLALPRPLELAQVLPVQLQALP